MEFIYWIKFIDSQPFRIRAKSLDELLDLIKREHFRYNTPCEWIIRD